MNNSPKIWSMAIGSATGKIYQIDEGLSAPLKMLPPCSNRDIPEWVNVIEYSAYQEKNRRLIETNGFLHERSQALGEINETLATCLCCVCGAVAKAQNLSRE